MPLDVIGAGYGRTGTMSTQAALIELGFPCYHMKTVMQDGPGGKGLRFWEQIAEAQPGQQADWETVFADYRAAVDFPASCVWQELVAAYPDAKVLLTVHPGGAQAWFESAWDTIYFSQRYWQFKLLRIVPPVRRFSDMVEKLVWKRTLKDSMPDKPRVVAVYEAHLKAVQDAVPADQLLLFNVKDGWAPLCEFLDVPVPESPFPNINERRDFRRMINIPRYTVNFVLAGIVGAVLYSLVF